MTRRPLLLASLAAVAALAGGCGEPSVEDRRTALAEDLVAETDGALDADVARCVADGLYAEFDEDSLDLVVAVAEGAEDDADVRRRVVDVFADCDALGSIANG